MEREGSTSIVSPGAYVVCDGGGDFGPFGELGLFYRDVRHLSEFVLRIDGLPPKVVGRREWGSGAEFSLVASVGSAATLDVSRRRALGGGMEEEILLFNGSRERLDVRVELEFGADFLDIFEVRGYARSSSRGDISREVADGGLRFGYVREGFRRGTVVSVSGEGLEPVAEPGRVSVRVRIEPGETRSVLVSVGLEEGGVGVPPLVERGATLYGDAPALETNWSPLDKSWRRSLEDLESLAFDSGEGLLVPAAGAPWYMALFGRDALITAYQTLLLGPGPAKSTLRALARCQAQDYSDFQDSEPGKILHEVRRGELAYFGEVPHSPYYGTADATPLFLVLLGEVWRWTADGTFVRELEQPARRAVAWLLENLDSDERGYVAYETRSAAGLRNHGWKDSDDAILFRDGERAEPPISLCEVQGYAYDALLRTAALAEHTWKDGAFAGMLREKAAELKVRFDRDFWIEERGYYALALDGFGRRVDSVTSNAGHLLWSGIAPESKARAVADRLLGTELFSGWGVRTMATGDAGYDPNSYHNGSVWPHDNAVIAEGLRRYGFREEARRVATALVEAAAHFGYRLPEVFAGYQREEGVGPVGVPLSCSPQAWAAGTVPSLVRTMLALDPDPGNRWLTVDPHPGKNVSGLRLGDVAAFGVRHRVGI